MLYRRLGQSGLKVSEICLGTMTFGRGADLAEATRITEGCLDVGVNFFDTANSYAESASETMLGEILKQRRRQAVIASKLFSPLGPGRNDSCMLRAHIMQAIEDSLRR
jgi:aryl-alcohol dehydrogenase-like predicted oxidoreductase